MRADTIRAIEWEELAKRTGTISRALQVHGMVTKPGIRTERMPGRGGINGNIL